MAAILVLNTPDDGRLRPKHVELLCRNKTCTVLHQLGVSFDFTLCSSHIIHMIIATIQIETKAHNFTLLTLVPWSLTQSQGHYGHNLAVVQLCNAYESHGKYSYNLLRIYNKTFKLRIHIGIR